jgi:hypothetical protein
VVEGAHDATAEQVGGAALCTAISH